MSTTNNGGPAFPAGSVRKTRSASDPGADFVVTDVVAPKQPGMTLRDYFAAKAMQGFLTAEYAGTYRPEVWAKEAYGMADAMLKAREVK